MGAWASCAQAGAAAISPATVSAAIRRGFMSGAPRSKFRSIRTCSADQPIALQGPVPSRYAESAVLRLEFGMSEGDEARARSRYPRRSVGAPDPFDVREQAHQ